MAGPLLALQDSPSLSTPSDGLRTVLDTLPAGVAWLRELRIQYCNAPFAAMLGYAAQDLVGRSSRAWHADDAQWAEVERRCAAALKSGQVFDADLTLQRQDGSALRCHARVQAQNAGRPEAGMVWLLTDVGLAPDPADALQRQVLLLQQQVAQYAESASRAWRQADIDELTSLPNRTLLARDATQAIAQAHAGSKPLAMLYLDLDRFKYVNDSLGHRIGDQLLAALAKRLRSAVRERDLVARLGGDEFMLVLPDTDVHGAAHVADKLMASTEPVYDIAQRELSISSSIGIAMYPQDGEDFDTLTQRADAAVHQAKRNGGSAYRFFTPAMQSEAARALAMENALRRALERQQFTLAFQPMVDLRSGHVSGVEALLRWRHPELGNVSPAEFIPLAEACGLIDTLGEWALRNAAFQLKAWRDRGLPGLTMAVNLSAMQLQQTQLPALIDDVLREAGLVPSDLELELTEGAAMQDPQHAIAVLQALHERGLRVSIDDFGTGHSSLSYLKRFRAYKLKIDQSFVRDISVDADDRAIVAAIIHMASSLGLQTIAEGVETEAQLRFLRQQGCDEAQGYLFSRPLSATQLEAFVRDLQQP
ncbi:putative bifunctional diguanylate cyclase/phosphodiesterase [Pseudorhodoferax soli]|uniref:PAS domain S-box-containing protein/diguanylate cyclase (GGDEF)-like protein n=1 Tax=Pseudorhodoferax soli TaxID=545864 RepID=A0A368Y683_9BURK|nr:EAL domain-containing protein [Pseudorhodoferax soli]RCW75800.1 PAS domain S-box-containing protein/diguanylate cyclase (GGDEF)-like protein [Pseudorhodoferax soli]